MWKLTGDELRKNIEKKQLSESYEPPKNFETKFSISKNEMNGYCYYIIKPLENVKQKHILFLHGGGYVYEITNLHWEFLAKLVDSLNCTITVPIYPLSPKYSFKDVFEMLIPIYKQIISQVKSEDLVIMGDSAGGGMSLALAELLKEKKIQQPGKIILISPALDLAFDNPEVSAVEKYDPITATPALTDICRWYAREKGSKHYLVSPIYGNFEGLGKISLFTGTHDICNPDARKFKRMADEKGVEISYYEYPSMLHVWPLFFLPESKKATKQIIEIIKK